jgi:AcrR family transcriptional regulator
MPARSSEYMQQRRDHILDAALRCLQRQGLIETSLADICLEADISRGALYKHFESKDQILDGVLRKISQVAIDQFKFHDLSTMNSALTYWIDYIVGEGQKNLRLEFELMSLTRSNVTLHAVAAFGIAQRQSALEQSLSTLVDSGEIVEKIDIRATARALNAFLFGLFSLASVAHVSKADRRAALDAFLRGVVTKAVESKERTVTP